MEGIIKNVTIETPFGNVRSLRYNNGFYYNGNDICACIGYTVDAKGQAVVLGIRNPFSPKYSQVSDTMIPLVENDNKNTWFTLETLLNYMSNAGPRYRQKTSILYDKLCDREELLRPHNKEEKPVPVKNDKQKRRTLFLNIDHLEHIEGSTFYVTFDESFGLKRPTRKLTGKPSTKQNDKDMVCHYTGKDIQLGDDYLSFHTTAESVYGKDNIIAHLLVKQAEPVLKEEPIKDVINFKPKKSSSIDWYRHSGWVLFVVQLAWITYQYTNK